VFNLDLALAFFKRYYFFLNQIPSKSKVEVETPPPSNRAVVVPIVGVVVTVGTGVAANAAKVVDETLVPPKVAKVMAVLRPITVLVVVGTVGMLSSEVYRSVLDDKTEAFLEGKP